MVQLLVDHENKTAWLCESLFRHVNKYSRSHSQFCSRCSVKQESIPVGCVPTACKPYMLQWPQPDVAPGRGPQVNKFEQISSVGHQMSVGG